MADQPEKIAGPTGQRFDPSAVQAYAASIFQAHKLRSDDAAIAAQALVTADLRGVWSHGLARVPMYVARLDAGVAKPRPDIRITQTAKAALMVDGDDGLGLIVAHRAMEAAIRLAHQTGIACAGVRNSGHFGMAALYAQQAIDAQCIAWVLTNASPALPPHGGKTPHLGTSPLAFGMPTGPGEPPFLIDMAMTKLARGKLKFAAKRGEPIPEGLALDKDGKPTTDGAAAFEGVVLPFGGLKGSALSWMMDMAAGVATGAGFGGDVKNPFSGLDGPQNTGHLMIVMRADLFLPFADYQDRTAAAIKRAKALPKADGFSEIQTPGEPEARRMAKNLKNGITLSDDVTTGLRSLGGPLGLRWPDPLA